jgi:S-layer protein (TIGR01567 family)
MTTVASPNAGEIKMVNKDEAVTLSKNKDIAIMPGVNVKVADSNDIRYYIYKTITEPGDYEVRGAVFGTEPGNWNPQNFAGFFYDIKDNLGKENLVFVPDAANPRSLVADTGIAYTTTVEPKTFDFDAWGQFNVIGFLAEKYFAGYINNETTKEDVLYEESDDDNVLADDQLNKILIDDDTERTVTSGTPLELMEGYMLAIKEIDVDGNKVYVELSKDGAVVDSKVLSPSKEGASMKDKTYYFKKTVGDSKDLVTIAVHFKNAFRGANQNLATVDGIWQISEEFVDVSADQEFDKMTTVASPNAGEIKMVNKDEAVTLSKNKEISLMPGVNVKVADSNDIRYYIFKPVTIEGAAETPAANLTAEAKPAVEAPSAEAKAVETTATAAAAATTAEAAATEKVAAAKEDLTAAKENVTKTAEAAGAAKEAASTEAKKQPGFEGIFAIAGLLAVAYLVLGRKE